MASAADVRDAFNIDRLLVRRVLAAVLAGIKVFESDDVIRISLSRQFEKNLPIALASQLQRNRCATPTSFSGRCWRRQSKRDKKSSCNLPLDDFVRDVARWYEVAMMPRHG